MTSTKADNPDSDSMTGAGKEQGEPKKGLGFVSDLKFEPKIALPEETEMEKPEDIEALKELAESGIAQAQFTLSCYYQMGKGVEKNIEEFVKWCRKAADQDHGMALFNLAGAYYNGDGVEKDLLKSMHLYSKSEECGYPGGKGPAAAVSREIMRDPPLTLRLAKEGDLEAMFMMGNHYRKGNEVEEDVQKAFDWYMKAAELGHSGAQYNLGVMYVTGNGVPQSDMRSLEWFKKAADQGHKMAIETLKRLGEM
ncbi:MAG: tetratricopeptide repeat protein [Planctomycetota bacterium]|jgi:TPR repeat protein